MFALSSTPASPRPRQPSCLFQPLQFYMWDGDVSELLADVRKTIDDMAAGWTEEEKEECLNQTEDAFMAGGSVLESLRT